MRVVAVVLNWNGGDLNLDCIASILDQGLAQEDVIFVDNASSDGSVAKVQERFPDLTLIQNQANLGFGDGVNQGILYGLGLQENAVDAVLLVNNDVVLPRGVLAELQAVLEKNPSVGITGPRVLYRDNPEIVWCAGGKMTYRQNLSNLLGHGEQDGPAWQGLQDVDYVAGCAMLVRRVVFEKAGLFDGDYFAYHEDVDFCLTSRKVGFGVMLAGDSHALHAPHHSTGGTYGPGRKYMMGVNTVWFLRRHGTPLRWLGFLVFDVMTLLPLIVVGAFTGRLAGALAKARGTMDGLLGRRVTEQRLAARLDNPKS
jgi:GT2 family glycosyltransferase